MDLNLVVVIVLVSVLLILIIVLTILVLKMKMKRQWCFGGKDHLKRASKKKKKIIKNFNQNVDNNDSNQQISAQQQPDRSILKKYSENRKSKKSTSILATNLYQYVTENKSNSELYEQFESIPFEFPELTTKAYEKPENKAKNKYLNIKPYDKTRVTLEIDETCNVNKDGQQSYHTYSNVKISSHNDYINANFITGYNQPKEYIASQGTKDNTEVDFWRMVSSLRVSRIVMLTNIRESTPKCSQYWPRELKQRKQYGLITVEMMNEEIFADFAIRVFKVEKGEKKTVVRQYHYTAWPDKGVPEFPTSLLEFRNYIRMDDMLCQNREPMIVHCSAGVGRTGTFILIDSMLKRIEKEDCVDLCEFLLQMRQERMYLIQTPEQYLFAYEALMEAYESGKTAVEIDCFRNNYITFIRDYENRRSIVHRQFEKLQKLRPTNSNGIDKESFLGYEHDNRKKNRPSSTVSLDISRTCFENVTYIDDYRYRNAFIVTQAPMKETIIDFYRLVSESNSRVIVMLNDINENENYPRYWPTDKDNEIVNESFTLKLLSEKEISGVVESQFIFENNDKTPITHLRLKNWQSDFHSTEGQKCLSKLISRAFLHRQDKPIIVHCLYGTAESGIFTVAGLAIDKMYYTQKVDIFHTAKIVKGVRPQDISTIDQYRLCFETVYHYLAISADEEENNQS